MNEQIEKILEMLKIFRSIEFETVKGTNCFEQKREDYATVLDNHDTGGYRLKVYHKGKYKRISKFTFNNLYVYEAEIIGNIHDNKMEELRKAFMEVYKNE